MPVDGGEEAVKLRDVGTRQELLNLAGLDATAHSYAARWSAVEDAMSFGPWPAQAAVSEACAQHSGSEADSEDYATKS